MSRSIAIDGPGGAGKSTIAKLVAKKKNFIYVDTGAMYRTLGLYFTEKGIPADDLEAVKAALPGADIQIAYEDGVQQVYLNGRNVSVTIRGGDMGTIASMYSALTPVREKLVDMQRKMAEVNDVVMDGRDIGTVVLPNADLKIFLTASAEERARRRYEEDKLKNPDADYEYILKKLIERDYADSHRENSPLRKAEDAILLDSSDLTIEEVADKIIAYLEK